MAGIIWDTVEGSELDDDDNLKERVRAGHVEDVSLEDAGSPAEFLEAVSDIVYDEVAPDSPYSDASPDCKFRRLRVIGTSDDSARVLLYFNNYIGGGITSYIITNGGSIEQYEGTLLPGVRLPIRVSWTDPDNANNKVPEDSIPMRFYRPLRELNVVQITSDRPAVDYSEDNGKVNDGTWCGKDAGYWMLKGVRSTWTNRGLYQLEATAWTRCWEDFSEFGALRHQVTGRYVKLDPSEISDALLEPYSYGTIYTGNGFKRVGGSPTIDFAAIFGFTSL